MPPKAEPSDPYYNREGRTRAMLSTTTDPELREVLKKETSQTTIAIETVNTQLKLWKDTLEKQAANNVTCQLLGLDITRLSFKGYLGENVQEDVSAINKGVEDVKDANEMLKKGVWSWTKLPYPVKRGGSSLTNVSEGGSEQGPMKRTKVLENDELVDDVDEWVLRNEFFLRTLSKPHVDSASFLKPWSVGLVRISDLPKTLHNCTPITSPDDSNYVNALKISRFPVDALPGYTILTDKRLPTIFAQASSSDFKGRFDCMTGGLLAGLDWNNIFVAGGLVLGALLTPDIPPTATVPALERLYLNQPAEWISSDIDLYIYGLDVIAANEKIKQIADVYQCNLGSADAPFLIVRNSQTVTLYSEWPKRRVQIVLKLVKSPREVLLNFDLDICAVGWDGKEVWMLPRFVRALETGTNVFTMDLVNGHYLGDRKATRDKRVFKYAKRGYGIRIIPLYIGYLSPFQSADSAALLSQISLGEELSKPPLSLSRIVDDARTWTREVVNRYIQNGWENVSASYRWPGGRQWPKVKGKNGLPVFSHAMLEGYGQITSEPLGRSCLTGFGLLMRHVALWELEREGMIEIYEHIFAEDAYNNIGQVAYDDTPAYEWDDKFSVKDFTDAIDRFNDRETNVMAEEWDNVSYRDKKIDFPKIKRVTYTTSIEQMFSSANDITIPLFVAPKFIQFANDLVVKALEELGLDKDKTGEAKPAPLAVIDQTEDYDEVLAVWHLNSILNWQMVDRRIDEVREVLWAFHRANERLYYPEEENRIDYLKTNISKRAIRISEKDENHAFVRWVGREPYQDSTNVNGIFLVEKCVDRGQDNWDDEDLDASGEEED